MEREIIKNYLLKFDELNTLTKNILTVGNATDIEELYFMLIDGYVLGFEHADYMLGLDDEIDADKMNKVIDSILNESFDGQTIREKYIEYVSNADEASLNRLIDTTFHKAYNIGAYDCASNYDNVGKMWLTVGDDRVRDTHAYLDGVVVDLDSYFYTYDDDKALYPSGFTKVENNVNCRCIIKYVFR